MMSVKSLFQTSLYIVSHSSSSQIERKKYEYKKSRKTKTTFF